MSVDATTRVDLVEVCRLNLLNRRKLYDVDPLMGLITMTFTAVPAAWPVPVPPLLLLHADSVSAPHTAATTSAT